MLQNGTHTHFHHDNMNISFEVLLHFASNLTLTKNMIEVQNVMSIYAINYHSQIDYYEIINVKITYNFQRLCYFVPQSSNIKFFLSCAHSQLNKL